jgi:hypothetical protein
MENRQDTHAEGRFFSSGIDLPLSSTNRADAQIPVHLFTAMLLRMVDAISYLSIRP